MVQKVHAQALSDRFELHVSVLGWTLLWIYVAGWTVKSTSS
jgi:uncharacterized membrane protein